MVKKIFRKILILCGAIFLSTACVKDHSLVKNESLIEPPLLGEPVMLEEPRDVPAAFDESTGPQVSDKRESLFFRADTKTVWPTEGRVSSEYGRRKGRFHRGLDIAATQGSPIYAAKKGRIEFIGRRKAYGLTIVVRHDDGTQTLYAHCKKFKVKKNQLVRMGQIIAYVGRTGNATGAHLHFEYMLPDSTPINPRVLFSTENIVSH